MHLLSAAVVSQLNRLTLDVVSVEERQNEDREALDRVNRPNGHAWLDGALTRNLFENIAHSCCGPNVNLNLLSDPSARDYDTARVGKINARLMIPGDNQSQASDSDGCRLLPFVDSLVRIRSLKC